MWSANSFCTTWCLFLMSLKSAICFFNSKIVFWLQIRFLYILYLFLSLTSNKLICFSRDSIFAFRSLIFPWKLFLCEAASFFILTSWIFNSLFSAISDFFCSLRVEFSFDNSIRLVFSWLYEVVKMYEFRLPNSCIPFVPICSCCSSGHNSSIFNTS